MRGGEKTGGEGKGKEEEGQGIEGEGPDPQYFGLEPPGYSG